MQKLPHVSPGPEPESVTDQLHQLDGCQQQEEVIKVCSVEVCCSVHELNAQHDQAASPVRKDCTVGESGFNIGSALAVDELNDSVYWTMLCPL